MDVVSYLMGKKAGGGGAVLQSKSVEITQNGETTVSPDTGYNGLSSVGITANVQPDLESKSLTISTNTTTTITPTQGKDGLSSVEITTNVPAGITPTGTINITTNGTHDVTTYASANVNVPSQKYAPNVIQFGDSSVAKNIVDLSYETSNLDTSNLTTLSYIFANLTSLTTINIDNWDVSNVKTMEYAFQQTKIRNLDLTNWNTSNITYIPAMFYSCTATITIDLNGWDTSKVTNMGQLFYNCSSATSINIPTFTLKGNINISGMFTGCTSLQHIDARNMRFELITSSNNRNNLLGNASGSTNVPFNCEIIVKDNNSKNWFNTNFPNYTNVKTVAEYEA